MGLRLPSIAELVICRFKQNERDRKLIEDYKRVKIQNQYLDTLTYIGLMNLLRKKRMIERHNSENTKYKVSCSF